MKRIVSFFISILILLSSLSLPITALSDFKDIQSDDWFAPSVARIAELGYMNGTSADSFSPYDPVNRAMAVQVLYNVSGEDAEYSPYFSDVNSGAWYAEAVCWAKAKGIANGTSKTRFSPNALMTREQLACFIDRYIDIYGAKEPEKKGEIYADIENVSDWARDAVIKMAENKIISPRTTEFFYPEATVSRAEFASFILSMKGEAEAGKDTSVHVQLIYTNIASAALEKGQSINVSGILYPEDSTDTKIQYSSSDPCVATVDAKGTVCAKKAGKARITLTSRDGGFTSYSEITVTEIPFDAAPSKDLTYNSPADNSAMKPIGNVRDIDPDKPMVALTYDDGPHRTYTNRILDTMERYGTVATFFELGNRVSGCEDILKREAALGCEVANHSYSHPNLSSLSATEVYDQINNTNNLIYNACGVWPELVRPPYGSNNSTVRSNVGAPIIHWSIDTLDWKHRDASYVTSVIKSNVTDGSVILMHSLYDSTAKATEIIVPWLLSQGYQLVTVSELAEMRGVDMQDGKVYYSFYK